MSHIPLSQSEDWQLKFPEEQDVRGADVRDASGAVLGTVDDMIVDTEAERVSHLLLSDGTRIPAEDVTIANGTVTVDRTSGTTAGSTAASADIDPSVTVFDDSGRTERVEPVGFDAFDDDFRTHHATAHPGDDYGASEPAYRYGYDRANAADHRDRAFDEVEPALRSGYASAYADRDFDADRDAIRHAFTTARQRRGS